MLEVFGEVAVGVEDGVVVQKVVHYKLDLALVV